MVRTFAVAVVLTACSVLGYVVGVLAAYPGRSFAITGVMVGVTLLAVADGGADA